SLTSCSGRDVDPGVWLHVGVTAGWPRCLRRRARLVHAVWAVPWDELGQRHHHAVAVGAWPAADLQQRVAHVAAVLGAVAAGALSAGGDHADPRRRSRSARIRARSSSSSAVDAIMSITLAGTMWPAATCSRR